MPNWCENSLRLSHSDPVMISRAAAAIEADRLLEEFIPRPADQEDNWYDWNIENWGTKWDIADAGVSNVSDTELYAYFGTAWAPPVEAYARLEALGFKVGAMYYEPGMAYYGSYADGVDTYAEYSTFDEIPEDIVDEFGIEDWEEYEDSEDSAEDPTED